MVGEIRMEFDGSGADKAESKLKSVGGSMQKVGKMATVGLSAPIAAGFGVAVNEAASFEEAMVGVEKVTNPEIAERMGEAIKGMAAEMPLAHEELATIAETAGQLGVGEEHLESFTRSVAKMSVATDLTAQEAADSFARISTLMELPVEDAEKLGSAINELSNNFGASASEITDVMTRAGGAFNALGLGEDQALGLAAAMNEVSPSSRLAAGGLKRISEMLMDPKRVNQIADAFGMTSGELQKMIDNDPSGVIKMLAQEMQTGSQTSKQLRSDLGKQASELTTLGSNWGAVEQATKDAAGQFENATSLQEEFDAASSSVSSQLQITKNQFKNVAIAIGDALLPYIRAFNDILQSVAKRLMGMSDAQRTALITVAALVAAIGPLIFAVGTVLTLIPSMVAGWAALSGAFATVGAVASGGLIPALVAVVGAINPIVWVIGAAIGAAMLLAAAWSSNFGGIRKQTMRVVGVLREELAPAINWLKNVAASVMSYFGGEGAASFAKFSEAAKPVIALIADGLIFAIRGLATVTRAAIAGMQTAWQVFGPTVMTVLEAIAIGVQNLITVVSGIISVAKAVWVGDWEEAWMRIYDIPATILARIAGFLNQWFPGLTTTMAMHLMQWRLKWYSWGMNLISTVTNAFNRVKAVFTTALATLNAIFGPSIGQLLYVWKIFSQQILAETRLTWNAIRAKIAPLLSWLRSTIPPILAAIQARWVQFSAIVRKVVTALASVVRTVVTAFMSYIRGRFNATLGAIRGFWSTWGGDITAIARQVGNTIKTIIVGWMDIVKTVIIAGLRVLRGDWSGAWDAMAGLTSRTTGRIRHIISGWVSVLKGLFGTMKREAIQAVRSMVDRVVGLINSGKSRFARAGRGLINSFKNAIKRAASGPIGAVKNIVKRIRRLLPGSDARDGPLSDLSKTGPALVETFAAGIASKADLAASAAETVAQAAKRPLENMSLQDMVSNLSHGQRMDLSHVLEDTGFVDKYYKASAMLRKFGEGGAVSGLSNALSGGPAGRALRRMARNGPRDEGPMVRAEDGSMVPASYYNKRSKPARHERKRAEPERVKIDFGDLDDDDYVSVGALKQELKEYVKKREHDAVKRATDGDFTI